MVTNRALAKKFSDTYPKTNYHLQTLLVNTSKFLKSNNGKDKNPLTGKNNDASHLRNALHNTKDLLEYMYYEAVFSDVKSREDIVEVCNILIDRYKIIYPNWANEYHFIQTHILTNDTFSNL